MRAAIAAAATVAIVLLGYFGAPLVPVALGAALTCAYYWWRAHGRHRAL
jgi:hypothetical protein